MATIRYTVGGTKPPFVCRLETSTGSLVKEEIKNVTGTFDILNIAAGSYYMKVMDSVGCQGTSDLMTIEDDTIIITPSPITVSLGQEEIQDFGTYIIVVYKFILSSASTVDITVNMTESIDGGSASWIHTIVPAGNTSYSTLALQYNKTELAQTVTVELSSGQYTEGTPAMLTVRVPGLDEAPV